MNASPLIKLDDIYLAASDLPTALRHRLANAPGTALQLEAVVLEGPLPEWVAKSPKLLAATRLDRAVKADGFAEALRAAGATDVEILAIQPVDPLDYKPLIEQDFFASGVALGCCGAIANPEVIRASQDMLCGVLRRVTFQLTRP